MIMIIKVSEEEEGRHDFSAHALPLPTPVCPSRLEEFAPSSTVWRAPKFLFTFHYVLHTALPPSRVLRSRLEAAVAAVEKSTDDFLQQLRLSSIAWVISVAVFFLCAHSVLLYSRYFIHWAISAAAPAAECLDDCPRCPLQPSQNSSSVISLISSTPSEPVVERKCQTRRSKRL